MPTMTIYEPPKDEWKHGMLFNSVEHEAEGSVLFVKREHNGGTYPPFIYFRDNHGKMKCKYLDQSNIPIEAFSQWEDNHHFFWTIYTKTQWAIITLGLI